MSLYSLFAWFLYAQPLGDQFRRIHRMAATQTSNAMPRSAFLKLMSAAKALTSHLRLPRWGVGDKNCFRHPDPAHQRTAAMVSKNARGAQDSKGDWRSELVPRMELSRPVGSILSTLSAASDTRHSFCRRRSYAKRLRRGCYFDERSRI